MIGAGHQKEGIRKYTLDEMNAYIADIFRRERESILMQLNIAVIGSRGDDKQVKQFRKAIEGTQEIPQNWIERKKT